MVLGQISQHDVASANVRLGRAEEGFGGSGCLSQLAVGLRCRTAIITQGGN